MKKVEGTFVIKEENTVDLDKKSERDESVADFETAIDAAGFGWYNVMLLLVTVFAVTSSLFKVSVTAYVIPAAECDIQLTLIEKGTLNAMVFVGMIPGGIFWGLISDTKGRKNILALCYCFDFFCVLCQAMSQSVLQMEILLLIGGFVLSGPFAIMYTYLAEMHSKAYRSRVISFVGMSMSIATLALAALSLIILTKSFRLNFFSIQVRPWQLFLAICGIPSLVAGVFFAFFPESPKFLMSRGENGKALKIFQLIYSINYHKSKTDYPITKLVDELAQSNATQESSENKKNISITGLKQFRPLFGKQYLCKILLICSMIFTILIGSGGFRLWLPQLFAFISEYRMKYPHETLTMCKVIEYSVNKSQTMVSTNDNKICETVYDLDAAYSNIYVALTGIAGFLLTGYLVTILTRKTLLSSAILLAAILMSSLIFINSMTSILILTCAMTFLTLLTMNLLLDYSTTLFPTSLRAMVVSLVLIFTRSGSLVGNVLFPIFMHVHCIAPFAVIACLYLLGFLCSFFLTNTQNMSLV